MSGRWQRFRLRMIIVGPPLVLLVIGAAVYIVVVKLSEPEVQTIQAIPDQASSSSQPQASQSTILTSIVTDVSQPSASQLSSWQSEVDRGQADWRTDSLQAAKRLAADYGFEEKDTFSRQSSASANLTATVIEAHHQGKLYHITMNQPGKAGAKGVWVIKAITQQD